ncbi:MAG: TlyA family RNA methyltransferase [Clostridia bacterium]|nr:TlyA family RNA methyltransferase [Clostridia bacterium]
MRADKYFSDKFGSRTKAAEALEKGLVLVNGKKLRAKDDVKETDDITFVKADEYFVSNGGYKLSRALKSFDFDCNGLIFADIGASTGGFTDCLLQNGAKKVYAVDVGESLLHDSLKRDNRVVLMENTNARYLSKSDFEEEPDGVTADVSFISLRLILPVIADTVKENGVAFVLLKPQFECEKKHIGKSGIVHPSAHADIVKKVYGYCLASGMLPFGIVNAPIRKGKNIEYVLYLKKSNTGAKTLENILEEVKNFVRHNSTGELK